MHACMLSHFRRVWLFVAPWTVAHQAPLSMGFSRQEYWSGWPCPPPGDLLNPGIEPKSYVSCIDRWVLYHLLPPGKPHMYIHTHTHVYTHVCKGTNTYAYLFLNGSDITLCICFVSTEKCILESIPNLKLDQTHLFCLWHSFPLNDGKIIIWAFFYWWGRCLCNFPFIYFSNWVKERQMNNLWAACI